MRGTCLIFHPRTMEKSYCMSFLQLVNVGAALQASQLEPNVVLSVKPIDAKDPAPSSPSQVEAAEVGEVEGVVPNLVVSGVVDWRFPSLSSNSSPRMDPIPPRVMLRCPSGSSRKLTRLIERVRLWSVISAGQRPIYSVSVT